MNSTMQNIHNIEYFLDRNKCTCEGRGTCILCRVEQRYREIAEALYAITQDFNIPNAISSKNLKPCPHCGSPKVRYFSGWAYGDRNKDDSAFRKPCISCDKCGCGFYIGAMGRGVTDEDAYKKVCEAYNRRFNEGLIQGEANESNYASNSRSL